MPTLCHPFPSLAWLIPVAALFADQAYADQLVYVPLSEPCRLLDTRASAGGVPLTAAHGAYLFGTSDSDIQSASQHGRATGCGVPAGSSAVSVNMNLLNTTASGNIVTWSADTGSAPNIGTAVYNPSVASPAAGQVLYNTGYTTIPLGKDIAGKFHLQVANGQIDMTMNVVGYWLPISWNETRSGDHAIALGTGTTASEVYSTALGYNTVADGGFSLATGYKTEASGGVSTALGYQTVAAGNSSTAMGANTIASGVNSTAMGDNTWAKGQTSIAMGKDIVIGGDRTVAMGNNINVSAIGTGNGSFYWGDASSRSALTSIGSNEFVAYASGGVAFFTGPSAGVYLGIGAGSWTTMSDRNAKTAVQPVDAREVLKKVAALPLNTWQYKTQEAKYRHMGPMAQDFYAAFKLGESDKGIDTVDADGVALVAIQGLNTLLIEKGQQIAELRSEKDQEIAVLKSRIASLESVATDLAEVKSQLARLSDAAPAPVVVAQRP